MPKARDHHFQNEFQTHTRLKHLVLETYLKAWAMILLQRKRRVWIVDAFAGSGTDTHGNPGSPVIAAKIAVEVQNHFADDRGKVCVIAIEKDRDRFITLRNQMAQYDIEQAGQNPVAYLRHSTLAEKIDGIFRHANDAPIFFFLDPFGVDGLQYEVVSKALRGPQNEVLALFSDIGAGRLLGVLAAEPRDMNQEITDLHRTPSLFPQFDVEDEAQRREEITTSNRSKAYTKAAAEQILTKVFGTSDIGKQLATLPKADRSRAAAELYGQVLQSCGATFILPMAIRNSKDRHVYYLLHASKSATAFKKMKEATQTALTKSALPDEVKRNIRIAHRYDIDSMVHAVSSYFAGHTVRWQGSEESVLDYVMSYTPYLAHMRDSLQQALTPWLIQQRPRIYRFPRLN